MSVSDPIADMLTKIRNANLARREMVNIANSKMKLEIIKILKNEGYIKTFRKINHNNFSYIRVFLKYDQSSKPVIHGIDKISTPGRRKYSGYKGMPRILNNYGTLIVSTSSGVTTSKKAREYNIGGELICKVW